MGLTQRQSHYCPANRLITTSERFGRLIDCLPKIRRTTMLSSPRA